MLFLEILRKKRPNEELASFYFTPLELREAMEETIRVLMSLSIAEGIKFLRTCNSSQSLLLKFLTKASLSPQQ